MQTPVLICAFNRPNHLRVVLDRLANLSCSNVTISIDGPRNEEDVEAVNQTTEIAKQFTLSNGGKVLSSNRNSGCSISVYNAISDFLAENKEGVILEDDTLPGYDFFDFATALLDRFREDNRVGMISGNNHSSRVEFTSSYAFSRNKATWGWATWLRSWKGFDLDAINSEIKNPDTNVMLNMGWSQAMIQSHWPKAFNQISSGRVDTWDWQWFYWLAKNNQLSVVPAGNLVANLGFDENATHTLGNPHPAFVNIKPLPRTLQHPASVVPFVDYEKSFEEIKYFFANQTKVSLDTVKRPVFTKMLTLLPARLVSVIARLLHRFGLLSTVKKMIES